MNFDLVRGKCNVVYSDNVSNIDEYSSKSVDNFYFTEVIISYYFYNL